MSRLGPDAIPSRRSVAPKSLRFPYSRLNFSLAQTQLQHEKEKYETMSKNTAKENGKLMDAIAKLEEEKTRRMPPDVQGEVRRLKRENHKTAEELKKKNDQVNLRTAVRDCVSSALLSCCYSVFLL